MFPFRGVPSPVLRLAEPCGLGKIRKSEAEETPPHYFHGGAAGEVGGDLPEDPLPGCDDERGAGQQGGPERGESGSKLLGAVFIVILECVVIRGRVKKVTANQGA